MTTNTQTPSLIQITDWRAAVIAGIFAGIAFQLIMMVLSPTIVGHNTFYMPRLTAAIVLGRSTLPPATMTASSVVIGLFVHFVLSILFTMLLAFLIHRWGIIVGILGGALFGLALYAINFWTLTYFFDWFFAARTWLFVLAHILFGAVGGGVYEILERDIYTEAVSP
jgi:hypothetical protein